MATAVDRGTGKASGFRREVGLVGLLCTSLGSVIGSGSSGRCTAPRRPVPS